MLDVQIICHLFYHWKQSTLLNIFCDPFDRSENDMRFLLTDAIMTGTTKTHLFETY